MTRPITASTQPQSLSADKSVSERDTRPIAIAGEVRRVEPTPVRDHSRANGWLAWPARDSDTKLRLFCFPYAGGSGTLFRPWRTELPAAVDVCGIQLPGRGARVRESHFRRMSAVVPAIAQAILPLCDRPFALFGHSLGAAISFEVARHLYQESGREPVLLIVSGRRAPQLPSTQLPIYALPHDAFIQELRRFKGTPDEILLNEELMELLLPTLRADFEICDTYQFRPGNRLTAPITVFGGADDEDDTRAKLESWRSATSGPFTLKMFPGGHFFIHTAESLLLRALSADLEQIVTTLG